MSLSGCDTQQVVKQQPKPATGTNSGGATDLPGSSTTPTAERTDIAKEGPTGDPNTVAKKADVGAGAKGHYSQGFVTTPLSSYFRAQERLQFQAQIPHAIQLFEATNGRPLKSHQEFMTEIIQANRINLPELPPGHKYVYDPKKKELMIEQPATEGTPQPAGK